MKILTTINNHNDVEKVTESNFDVDNDKKFDNHKFIDNRNIIDIDNTIKRNL